MSAPKKKPSSEDRSDLDALKASVDLAEVITACGLGLRKLGRHLAAPCPFHADTEASFVVNTERQLWNCFGCQTGGDVLSFLQLREGLTFPEAVAKLKTFAASAEHTPARIEPSVPATNGRLPGGFRRAELLERVAVHYIKGLQESRIAQAYLAERKLASAEMWSQFRLGYGDGSLMATIPERGDLAEALTQLGVITKRGKEFLAGCLVVPLEHPDEGIVGFYGRRVVTSSTSQAKHLYLPGPHHGVFNWQALKVSSDIILAESVIDALSVWMTGMRNVSCLYGAGGLPKSLGELISRFGVRRLRLCMDNDAAGQAGAERLASHFGGRGIHCVQITLSEGADANDVLRQQGPTALRAQLENAMPFVKPATEAAQPAASNLPPTNLPAAVAEAQPSADGFVLKFEDTVYKVTPRPPFGGRLRVTLRVTRGPNKYLDTIDLYSHRLRSVGATQIARRLDVPKEAIERHFVPLVEEAERWVNEHAEADNDEATERPQQAPQMSEEEREEALVFLRDRNLVQLILEDMEALGYVGEERGKLLSYLIGISRRLDRPLSGIVISQSSAGKSSMTDAVEQLTPAEEVVLYSRISAQALGYMPRDFLKRKLLILEERVGAEAAEYQIRVLQSRQRLSQAVVIKDPTTGKMRTRHFEVEGPIAYLETTTNPRINYENATRCFELALDESPEQTRRIHERQRLSRTIDGLRRRQAVDAIRARHHNAQRLLQPVRVMIPYVERLSFPSRWLRTRRDHERFLCLVEAAAFLHQYQRESGQLDDGTAYICATVEDYALAYNLAQDVLRATLHELTRDARELLEEAQRMIETWSHEGRDETVLFTRRDLRSHTSWQDHRLREALGELVEMEYVAAIAGSQGRTYHYRLMHTAGGNEPLPLRELTTPQQLEAMLKAG